MASGGHTAHEAERQASRLPAFQAADPAHIDLFAAANVRLWDEIATVEHKRLDNQDGTSRQIMGCLPPGPLSPADDAPGTAYTGLTVAEQARRRLWPMRAEQVR